MTLQEASSAVSNLKELVPISESMLLSAAETRNAKAKLDAERTMAALSSVEQKKSQFMYSLHS